MNRRLGKAGEANFEFMNTLIMDFERGQIELGSKYCIEFSIWFVCYFSNLQTLISNQMKEQQRVLELQSIENKKPSQMAQLLSLLKKGSFGMVDAVLQYSYLLLTKFKASSQTQQPIYLDQYCNSALELHAQPQHTIQPAFDRLRKIFGDNRYIRRLSIAINHIFRTGREDNYGTAHTLYEQMMKEDLGDYDTRKRHLALLKFKLSRQQYIDRLNSHIQGNPSDIQAWQQISTLYLQTSNFHKAAFCYQQLITINPRNDHYFVRLGEILFTLGGTANLKNAKDYFCYVVTRDDKNYRALWCLNRVCRVLVGEHGGDVGDTIAELYQVTREKIKEGYGRGSKVSLTGFKF